MIYFKNKKNHLSKKKVQIQLCLEPINKIILTNKIIKKINNDNVTFYTSNPCIIKCPKTNNYILNIRWINYFLNKDGICISSYPKNISLNSFIELDESFNKINIQFLSETIDYKENYNFFGLEDIRLFNYSDNLYYIASSFNTENETISITFNKCILNKNEYILNKNFIIPSFYNYKRIEKNWCFLNYKEKLCFIYEWYPLTICEIKNNSLHIIDTKKKHHDIFKITKGSSSGFLFNNEIWFILHTTENNNYLHYFAIFDNNMNLLRYSERFKLDNCKIEYCIGLIIEPNRTILSFSSLDTNIYIGIYNNDYINYLKWINIV
jgi:hypothetical protein